jgi:malate dehydrogenase (oxaloacetate-decarboxylating)
MHFGEEFIVAFCQRLQIDRIGHADQPNQIAAALASPGIWRGALDCRPRRIDDGMLVAAARTVAATAGAVGPDNVVPSVLNADLVANVATAVREAAETSGAARLHTA